MDGAFAVAPLVTVAWFASWYLWERVPHGVAVAPTDASPEVVAS